jgi:SnoaL-like protein
MAEEINMALDRDEATVIASLSRAVLLHVFDEQDPVRRTATIERIFAENVRFVDHNGTHVGRDEISVAVERLQARLAGFRFTMAGEPQVLEGAARVAWRFGPPSMPDKITGVDTILVHDGLIRTLLVFLDQAPDGASDRQGLA